jgi:cytochrome c oxidase assembly protein subunit 15
MTAVAPIKLALHLTLAGLILAALVWLATGLRRSRDGLSGGREGTALRRGAYGLVALIFLQIALGGLVAGSRAGWTYNTWPLMDGRLVPPSATLFSGEPFLENFVDNLALVQFNHRALAVVLVLSALWHAWAAWRDGHRSTASAAAALALLVLGQSILGIVTLVLVVPLWAGLTHQIVAMAVVGLAVFHARRCAGPDARRSSIVKVDPGSAAGVRQDTEQKGF